jgi:photosynthetic reaction center cytochrome c subunit
MSLHNRATALALVFAAAALAAGCERPPIQTTQLGYRGVAMENVQNPRRSARLHAANVLPEVQPPAASAEGTPLAKDIYQNVQVLKDLDIAEFTRIMLAMTAWVSPKEGCNYCHNPEYMADDSKYTKIVSRRMIEMTRHINTDWTTHVVKTGVTCYTCHRGNNIPQNVWFHDPGPVAHGLTGNKAGQNMPAHSAGLASLPFDSLSTYLETPNDIRVISNDALPDGNKRNIKDTEVTYALMMNMSEGLGVNCTFCHNSRSFKQWDQSTPQRSTAWYGIRMARDLNTNYLVPLTTTFPASRLGPHGDVAKINCTTCHQGVSKPLEGQSMLQDYEALRAARPMPASAAPAADAPAGAASEAPAAMPAPAGKATGS